MNTLNDSPQLETTTISEEEPPLHPYEVEIAKAILLGGNPRCQATMFLYLARNRMASIARIPKSWKIDDHC